MSLRKMTDTEEAIEKYTRTVYGITLSHTPSKSDADDAYQETFLAYHRCGRKWQSEEQRKAWLIRTAINMCRRITLNPWRKRTAPLENADGMGEQFRYETAEQNEIYAALKKLPGRYRTVIWLYYFEELPAKDIASLTGAAENTVRSQLARGRDILKKILEREVDEL